MDFSIWKTEREEIKPIVYETSYVPSREKKQKKETKVYDESLSKVCSLCGQEKKLSEFYKHPTGHLGHSAKCKECLRKYQYELSIERGYFKPGKAANKYEV